MTSFNWIFNNTSPMTPAGLAGNIINLFDAPTITLDASLGNVFSVAALGDRTIDVPLNAGSGQRIVIIHYAALGTRTLTLSNNIGGFRFGSDITGLTATTANKLDYIGCIYNSNQGTWDVIGYVKGF